MLQKEFYDSNGDNTITYWYKRVLRNGHILCLSHSHGLIVIFH